LRDAPGAGGVDTAELLGEPGIFAFGMAQRRLRVRGLLPQPFDLLVLGRIVAKTVDSRDPRLARRLLFTGRRVAATEMPRDTTSCRATGRPP
jgi:hypothetical protein